jgi:hypothetical protein
MQFFSTGDSFQSRLFFSREGREYRKEAWLNINTMKKIVVGLVSILIYSNIGAQSKTDNVVIVTFDGFRWQEVFGGADSLLISDSMYVRSPLGYPND